VKQLADANVAIVGLGLMGGSLGAALKGRGLCRCVLGVARREYTIQRAKELGAIDRGSCHLDDAVTQADVVVLATPVRAMLELIPKLGALLQPGCILVDMGSTKADVVRAMEDLPGHIEPIGGHPMAGKETHGIDSLDRDLFLGATFVLTPLGRTSQTTIALVQELVCSVGARPLLLSPERHDRLVAATSHLPYLTSIALVAHAGQQEASDEALWDLVAGRFRDMSRLAESQVDMSLDILLTNRDNILAQLDGLTAQLGRLGDALCRSDEDELRNALCMARDTRTMRYP
jgi:prephenate dehydrogenase